LEDEHAASTIVRMIRAIQIFFFILLSLKVWEVAKRCVMQTVFL